MFWKRSTNQALNDDNSKWVNSLYLILLKSNSVTNDLLNLNNMNLAMNENSFGMVFPYQPKQFKCELANESQE